MPRIKVAVAGVGNLCSAFVQGVYKYRRSSRNESIGLVHPIIAGYKPGDIDFVAAFDVDARKVGRDLSKAILAAPNNTASIHNVPELGVAVKKAEPMDGISDVVRDQIPMSRERTVNVSRELKASGAEVLLNFIPTGAIQATRAFADAALQAECSFVNCTPAALASDRLWQRKFKQAEIPVAGDDLVDQIGATVLHKIVLGALVERGIRIDESYQLDIGGGTESLMALDKKRYEAKREIKRDSVGSIVPYHFPLVTGTSDYVDFMGNGRTSYFWLRGRYFGEAPFALDMTLNIVDGPAGAGIVIDIVRLMKLAMERGVAGPLTSVCAFGFKMPPIKAKPEIAQAWVEDFIHGRRPS